MIQTPGTACAISPDNPWTYFIDAGNLICHYSYCGRISVTNHDNYTTAILGFRKSLKEVVADPWNG
jgi:hypothetical protein